MPLATVAVHILTFQAQTLEDATLKQRAARTPAVPEAA